MTVPKSAEEVKNHLSSQMEACLGINLIYLGQKLGIFEALSAIGPSNAPSLAKSTGLSGRYLEEFLRAVAMHGYVDYCPGDVTKEGGGWDSGIVTDEGTFSLSPAMAQVLLQEESEHYFGNYVLMAVILSKPMDKIMEAFKTDTGVAYSDYGKDCSLWIEDNFRKSYRDDLVANWMQLEGLRDVKDGLKEGGVVIDLGCGFGESSINFAKGFPKVTVHAVDCDTVSIEKVKQKIEMAERNGEILPGQVVPHCCFAHETLLSPGSLDLILLFICLHDMSNPSEVLATAKNLLKPSGSVLVLEFTLPDTFNEALPTVATMETSALVRVLYSSSVLHCLPVCKVGPHSQAIGTCFSPNTMKVVAAKGGFSKVSNYNVNDGKTLFRLQV